jgi:Fe2+ transport system protein FeoA
MREPGQRFEKTRTRMPTHVRAALTDGRGKPHVEAVAIPTDGDRTRVQVAINVFGLRHFRPDPAVSATVACDSCPLGACPAGFHATVVCIACPALDAQRLRTLGLFEGAQVGVVITRSGIVLDVRGSRLALGWDIAAAITVSPLST